MERSATKNTKAGMKATSLGIKVLVPLTLVLAISLIGLSLVIINFQGKSLNKMGGQIKGLLSESNKAVGQDLSKMNSDVSRNLLNMSKTISDQLTRSTNSALKQEKAEIADGLVVSLEENAQSLAELLTQVAPPAILSNDLTALISYIKSAATNKNVVYALYFRPNEKPYVRYIDRNNEKIKEYLTTGQGKKKYEKVISASKKDPAVFLSLSAAGSFLRFLYLNR